MSRVLGKRQLVPHPQAAWPPVDVGARLTQFSRSVLKLEYVVTGDIAQLVVPSAALPQRTDGLWKTTCFEAFATLDDGPAYLEANFSPARQWALYRFESYREGMQPALDLPAPEIFVEEHGSDRLAVVALMDLAPFGGKLPAKMGLSAVIEARDGTKSYWALAHPPGAPDFHAPDCFALELPPQD